MIPPSQNEAYELEASKQVADLKTTTHPLKNESTYQLGVIFVISHFFLFFTKVNFTFLARINYMLIKSQIHDSKPRSRFRIQGLHVVQNRKPLSTIAGKIACNTAFYYLVYSYVH